jgi:enoyl-CoA hydratase/carnithine racemase
MSDAPAISLRTEGGIAHLLLSSPPRNEIGARLGEELARICEHDLPRLRARGLVVRGEGRHFSSGADIPHLKRLLTRHPGEVVFEGLAAYARLMDSIAALPFPVVAAIGGCCLGSGLELALACHYRVATKSAVLAAPEVEFGLMPGAGGTVRLPHLVGPSRAMELILTGRTVSAQEAQEMGLVDVVVDRKRLLDTALAVVEHARP